MKINQRDFSMGKHFGTVGMVLFIAPVAYAQVTATINAGYDDNPFRLSDANNDDGGAFLDGELRLEKPLGNGFAIDARVRQIAYDGDGESPDRTIYSATLEYETDSELFGKSAEYLFHGRVAGTDRTFVSRNTGLIGEFAGVQVPNRFDYNSLELRGRVDLEMSEESTLRVQLDARDRNYEDYTGIGLSNLNYQQIYANAIWRYEPTKDNDIRVRFGGGFRSYDNREGRALDGSTVQGSDLEFSFLNAEVSWKHDLNDENDIRLSYDFAAREDSVLGYFDTTRHRAAIRYRYRPNRKNRLAAQLEYSDFNYDNISAESIINNEENVGPNDGFNASVSYERRLSENEGRDVWLKTSIAFDDFDSPNTNFEYERGVFQVGIVVEF